MVQGWFGRADFGFHCRNEPGMYGTIDFYGYMIYALQPISIVDSAAFRSLLNFQRGPRFRDSDIPGRSKITYTIDNRARDIQTELKKDLEVY